MNKNNEMLESCLFEGIGKDENGNDCHIRVVSKIVDGMLVIAFEEVEDQKGVLV